MSTLTDYFSLLQATSENSNGLPLRGLSEDGIWDCAALSEVGLIDYSDADHTHLVITPRGQKMLDLYNEQFADKEER